MTIEASISLHNLTTFRIGGRARFFCCVTNIHELSEAIAFADREKIPFFVLGEGSNILVSDEGFPGLVIKMDILGIDFENLSGDKVKVKAGAGENWDYLVALTVEKGLYGLENLSFIPGTVGAAPVQNIGAYGAEVKDTITEVETFDTVEKKVKIFTHKACHFTYRDSFFKTKEGKRYIITSVSFTLNSKGSVKTEYKDVKDYFAKKQNKNPSLTEVRQAVIEIRQAKLPDVKKLGTAGSFFKNPIIGKREYQALLKHYPKLPSYNLDTSHVKIPAAWILDNLCNFKGYREKHVGVYESQALVLVNFGNATADEVLQLANAMQKCVKEKTGIDLLFEVQIV